jgi:ubiquinone/menaquinone biosynthesis C-methylase UbiE
VSAPDHFGGHASDYVRYRPTYPESWFQGLLELVPGRRLAWDCGTGNAQVARRLAGDFERILASDVSQKQLDQAPPHGRITYRCSPAQQSGLEAASVDLVTVATAVHWFDLAAFYGEVQRVLSPEGLLALWTYGPRLLGPQGVVALVDELSERHLAQDWPAGIELVKEGYRTLPFPFAEIAMPESLSELRWSAEALLGWVGTWSAVHRQRARTGQDPMPEFARRIRAAWPAEPDAPLSFQMPVHARFGRLA